MLVTVPTPTVAVIATAMPKLNPAAMHATRIQRSPLMASLALAYCLWDLLKDRLLTSMIFLLK